MFKLLQYSSSIFLCCLLINNTTAFANDCESKLPPTMSETVKKAFCTQTCTDKNNKKISCAKMLEKATDSKEKTNKHALPQQSK